MSLWGINTPPVWAPEAVATPAGWADPDTGELLVTIVNLSTTKGGVAELVFARLGNATKTKYKLGENFDIVAVYNEAITVNTTGGTPRITFKVGETNTSATYVSGSGTNKLTFRYAVNASHDGAPNTITSPIQLQSGTIKDADSAGATNSPLAFTFSHTALLTGITIDGIIPTLDSVALEAGTPFVTDDVITLTATFSEAVTVDDTEGTPYIVLDINGSMVNALYTAGSGTTELTFEYTVTADDQAEASEFDIVGEIELNGATILDKVGNPCDDYLFTPGDVSTVTVNAA